MDNQDLQYFINYLFHNKRLTEKQIKKRNYLLSKTFSTLPADVEQGLEGSKHEINESIEAGGVTKTVTTKSNETNANTNKAFVMLYPLDTASFLSKFNDPFGLKYLTHDFDPTYDGRPQTIEALEIQVNNIFKEKEFIIPKSLWVLISGFCSKGNWLDTFGTEHISSLNDPDWLQWSKENARHPINHPVYEKEIMSFRSTIRVVPPNLQTICQKAMKGSTLLLEQNKLEKADFYTNTHTLYFAIKRIIRTMNTRSDQYPNVNISYARSTDLEGRMLRHVIITQLHSSSDKSIEDAIDRLNRDPEAGDFGAIRQMLNGYCYWQVESTWDGKPKRWNILRTNEMPEVEDIDNDSIVGFKHILTFYIV